MFSLSSYILIMEIYGQNYIFVCLFYSRKWKLVIVNYYFTLNVSRVFFPLLWIINWSHRDDQHGSTIFLWHCLAGRKSKLKIFRDFFLHILFIVRPFTFWSHKQFLLENQKKKSHDHSAQKLVWINLIVTNSWTEIVWP